MGQESSITSSLSNSTDKQNLKRGVSEKIARSVGVELNEVVALSQFLLSNGYKLSEAELGRGGSAVVFAAQFTDNINAVTSPNHQQQSIQLSHKPLAIKLVKCKKPGKDEDIIKEFNILKQIHSPHVVEAIDLLQYQSPCNIILITVIEQCKYNLHTYMRQHKILPQSDILKICMQLATGLDSIHRQNILHLDIKPSNIMLGFDGNWKFIDMEVSVLLHHSGVSTGITQMYCSPEQLQASYQNPSAYLGNKITQASDVYSLGLVFCELLGGLKDKRQVIQHKTKEGNGSSILISNDMVLNQFQEQLYRQIILPMIQHDPLKRMDVTTVLKKLNQLQIQFQDDENLRLQQAGSQKFSPLLVPKCNIQQQQQSQQLLKYQQQNEQSQQQFRQPLSDRSHYASSANQNHRNSCNFSNPYNTSIQQQQFFTNLQMHNNNNNKNIVKQPSLNNQFNTQHLFNQTIKTLNPPSQLNYTYINNAYS